MINILNTVCSDFALLHILGIIRRIIEILGIVVPILLIIGGTIIFVRATLNPEDKKSLKSFYNSVASAVIILLLPFIINVIMATISAYGEVGVKSDGDSVAFNISNCWNEADVVDNSNSVENTTNSISEEKNNLNKN